MDRGRGNIEVVGSTSMLMGSCACMAGGLPNLVMDTGNQLCCAHRVHISVTCPTYCEKYSKTNSNILSVTRQTYT